MFAVINLQNQVPGPFQSPNYVIAVQEVKSKNGGDDADWVCVSGGKVIWTRPGIFLDNQLGWYDPASWTTVLSSDSILIVNKSGQIALEMPKYSTNRDPSACLFGKDFLSLDIGNIPIKGWMFNGYGSKAGWYKYQSWRNTLITSLVDTKTMKPMYSFSTLLVGRPIHAGGDYLDVIKVTNLAARLQTTAPVAPRAYLLRLNVRTKMIDREARLVVNQKDYDNFNLVWGQDFSKVKVFWGKHDASVMNFCGIDHIRGKVILIKPQKLRKDELNQDLVPEPRRAYLRARDAGFRGQSVPQRELTGCPFGRRI